MEATRTREAPRQMTEPEVEDEPEFANSGESGDSPKVAESGVFVIYKVVRWRMGIEAIHGHYQRFEAANERRAELVARDRESAYLVEPVLVVA